MRHIRTAFALALLMGGHHALWAKPAVVLELWVNELLPEDVRHFAAIKGSTKAVTVTIKRPGTTAVKRQRVDIKGDFTVGQISALLQSILGADESYWNARGPLGVSIVGDSRRTIVNTSWGNVPSGGDGASYVYTLEDGKWRYLYRCCRDSN
jgi:hypothetical protein